MSELKTLHCPHNWGFDNFKDIESHLLKKESGWLEEEGDSKGNSKYGYQVGTFMNFCLLSYEAYRKEMYHKALSYLARADVTDDFMRKYSEVFQHVIQASKVHILYAMKLLDDAKEIAVKLNNERYSEADKAAFMYVQCSLQMKYGDCRSDESVNLIKSALKIVKDEPEFCYLHGVILSRIRHFKHPSPPPSTEEFDALRRAVSLRKDMPVYAIALARLYMDKKYSVPPSLRKNYNDIAESIFRNLLKYHESLCGNDIARCIYNLNRIRFDPDLEEYVKVAQKKSNSSLVNHYVGLFYIRNKQYEEAYACFDNACNDLPFLTATVLLLMYRLNGDYISDTEIEFRIKEWTCIYKSSQDDTKLRAFFLSISQFYLITMDNLKLASLYFLNAAKYDVTERVLINITTKYCSNNYLSVLKNQLLSCRQVDETIVKARNLIKTLPTLVFTELNDKMKTPTVFDLRNNLI